MSLRFLLGILAPGPDQQNDFQNSETEINPQDNDMYTVIKIVDQNAAKFHIGMLSISLIIGLALGGFTIWWMEKKPFLSYVINLLIALVCRTFFSILFDGVVILGSGNVGGGNTLIAFEQISINLVLAFWLSLTIYLHARVQRNFKSEPTLNLYKYGVPGAAAFFAFIWIFVLQSQRPYELWWLRLSPFTQWIVNSFNLLCMLIQLALVADIGRIMMTTSLDNDSVSLFRKVSILMGVLVFIFWLQFGLFMGRLPSKNSSSYTYFFYFIDGMECAFVCLVLYFFNNWVHMLIDSVSMVTGGESVNSTASNEECLAGGGGRGIVTLDSVFMTKESGRLKKSEEETDVVYSNVVDPQRWEKILDLYKRLNKEPSQPGMVVEGDAFYCPLRTERKMSKRTQRSMSDESRKRLSSEHKNDKTCDHVQKRNAFYSSKYLILDSKGEVPKYLETRPSLSSMSGRGSSKESRMSRDYSPSINSVKADDLVREWLNDNTENTCKKNWAMQWPEEDPNLDKKPSESDPWQYKPVHETVTIDQDTEKPTEKRVSVTQKIISTIDSVFRHSFSGNTDRQTPTAEDSRNQESIPQYLSPKPLTENSETITAKAEIEKKPTESLNQSKNSLTDKILGLADEADEGEKPREVVTSEPRGLGSKPEVAPPDKNEKYYGETPVSNAQIKEQKDNEPKESNSESQGTYLNQYLTNSEFEKRRMSREKRESDQRGQGPKSIFSFPETISSMVNYFVGGRGGLLGPRTETTVSKPENLTADAVPRSGNEWVIERQSGKAEMTNFIQAKEQSGELTTIPSKATGEEECSPVKKISVSSGSEFSIERFSREQPRQEHVISMGERFSKSTDNPELFATEKTHTSSATPVESRKTSSSSSGSFSLEQYYQGLHNMKQKIDQKNQKRTSK